MSKLVVPASAISLMSGMVWKGALLLGPDAAARGDLARHVANAGCALIALDHSAVWSSGGYLYAASTGAPAGDRALTRLHLAVLIQDDGPAPPDGEITRILDHPLPTLRLDPRQPVHLSRLITRLRQA